MPIYEYQCTKCEHKLEALRKMSDEPLVDCPECGKPSLIKLVSAASFRLKGGGWYETDFKTGNKKQLAESESAAPKSEASSKSSGDKVESGSNSSKADGKSAAKDSASKPAKETKKTSSNAASSK